MKRYSAGVAVFAAFLLVGTASAVQLQVKEVKASSTLHDSKGRTIEPAQAADGRLSTPWAEGEASAGLGDWIEFQFGEEVMLSRLELYGGNWDSREFFLRNNRLKSIQVKFSNGSSQKLELADKMERQVLPLTAPVKTRSVRIVLKEVYPGSTFNDTYLADALFFNDIAGGVVAGVKAKAISSLPNDADATYSAGNLLDGLVDTVWCEGKKDAGIGDAITFTLPKSVKVQELRLLNGVGASEETYQKNNRVTKLKVELGGTVKELAVPDQYGAWQSLPLEGAQGSVLKLTVLETAAGSRFNDTCLSELQIVPAP